MTTASTRCNPDKDGLVYCRDLSDAGGRLYCGDEEVYVAPECRGVTDFLLADRALWQVGRIRINRADIRMKRAPIIGVPFAQALTVALSSGGKLQKSLFQVPEWNRYKGKAVVATLLAHTKEHGSFLEFEAWQFLDISDETFYVHAQIDKSLSFVLHIDAATQLHTAQERQRIAANGERIEGQQYTKHFRLDGKLPIAAAENLMDLFFPAQPLTREFLNAIGVA